MSFDRTVSRRARDASRAGDFGDARAPGRVSASALLQRRADATPLASGIVQRDGDGAIGAHAEAAVAEAASAGGGAPLPEDIRARFEASLGADLSAVRVHTGAASADASAAIGARAYTLGQDIHFGAGEYTPGSQDGLHLLAHEVAHTVQQAGRTATGAQFKLSVSQPADGHEIEADAAADAMVQGAPASVGSAAGISRATVARKATVEADKTSVALPRETKEEPGNVDEQFETIGGKALVDSVRALCAAWRTYRQAPASADNAMPGHGIGAKVFIPFTVKAGALPGWFKERASRELGPENLALLEEMMSVTHEGWGEGSALFNVKRLTVQHKYSMFAKGTPLNTALIVTVYYENNLPSPWKWHRDFAIPGLEVDVLGLAKGKKDKLSFSGTFDGTTTESYVGYENLNKKAVHVVKGPSVSAKWSIVSAGWSTGASATFETTPPVVFKNFVLKPPDLPKLDGDPLQIPDFSLSLGGAGAGVALAIEDAHKDVKAIPTVGKLVRGTKQFRARIEQFANGSAELPADGDPALAELVSTLAAWRSQELEPIRTQLEAHGLDFAANAKLRVAVEGWASLRWAGAKDESDRHAKNQALSEQRARLVSSVLIERLNPGGWDYDLDVAGHGAGVIAPDATPESVVLQELHFAEEALRRAELELAQATKAGSPDIAHEQQKVAEARARVAELKKLIDPSQQPKPDQEAIRRVTVRVDWAGQLIDLAAPSISASPVKK